MYQPKFNIPTNLICSTFTEEQWKFITEQNGEPFTAPEDFANGDLDDYIIIMLRDEIHDGNLDPNDPTLLSLPYYPWVILLLYPGYPTFIPTS